MPSLQSPTRRHGAWNDTNPEHVDAIAWLQARRLAGKPVEVNEFIRRCRKHWPSLLTWDDAYGAVLNRRTEARRYLRRFGEWLGRKLGQTISGFHSLHGVKDDTTGETWPNAYYPDTVIVGTHGPRAKLFADAIGRMLAAAAFLRPYNPTAAEQAAILAKIKAALS